MAKTVVVGPDESSPKIPFLRGILTRSLQDIGLTFEEAYALADAVRDELDDATEVTTDDLRDKVVRHLKEFGPTVVRRYQQPQSTPGTVLVRDAGGHTTQFSREQHRQILESSGLTYEESAAVTSTLYRHMTERGMAEIRSHDLGLLTYRYLRLTKGATAACRYLALVNYLKGTVPFVLLIGGAPGTGKSAIATEIAHRMEIARVQSTDLLREVMRMMMPKRLIPVLHRSSYDAWKAIFEDSTLDNDGDAMLVEGYRAQANLLSVPCEAVIRRSMREQTSLIIEGVHVQKSLVEKVPEDAEAIVVVMMLSVVNPANLRERFEGRGQQIDKRRAERYLQQFNAIWRLQSHLLFEADRGHVPIIVNNNREQVVRDSMGVIVDALVERLDATPAEVFT
jgi:2-phosphoglycerate kinase